MQQHHADPRRRTAWHDLAQRFAEERECLASFLALETAEVLAGEKPANLVNLNNRRRPCGRNLYHLWQRHGRDLVAQSGLAVRELAERGHSRLLLLYRPQVLAALLAKANVSGFLRRAGYAAPVEPEAALTELQSRFSAAGFPHEVGVFLGYPLKDVAGFLGWVDLPVTGQGPWKIYGNPGPSLALADTFRACRCRMARRLNDCATATDCLRVAGGSR
jgi:hypothetical protein